LLFSISVTVLLVITLAAGISMYLLYNKEKKLRQYYENQLKSSLETSKENINNHIRSLDNLVSMLVNMHQYSVNLGKQDNSTELYQTIVFNACQLMNTDSGSLMLLKDQKDLSDEGMDKENKEDKNKPVLTIVAAIGLPPEVVKSTVLNLGEGIAGQVAQTGRPLFVDDIEKDIRFHLRPVDSKYHSKSFLSVPLKTKERILGVLNVTSRSVDKEFQQREQRLITLLADQAAITLENIQLYVNIQKFYWDMVQTLARAIDAKDSYTREHADRSVKYTKAIAAEMSLPRDMTNDLEYAALMHDIGKIGIEEHILHKPGTLSNQERDIIKQHPQIGNRILSPVPFLSNVAAMILYHHEWYNGQGYLEGLSGEEIPIGARIIALIDSYDAMTSDRPYRKALDKKFAIEEIRRGAGVQFDPNVVEAFIRVLEREDNGNGINHNNSVKTSVNTKAAVE